MANTGLGQSMQQTAAAAQQAVPKLSAVANVLRQIGQSADSLKALANMGFRPTPDPPPPSLRVSCLPTRSAVSVHRSRVAGVPLGIEPRTGRGRRFAGVLPARVQNL